MVQTGEKKPRKRAGFWLWSFRIILILFVLLIITFAVLYFSGFFHNLLRQVIITELSKFTKSEVAIGELRGDLFTYVEIYDAAIGNQGSLADGKAITVRYARIHWSIWALINGRVKVDSIYAEDGYCLVTQNPGHTDLNVAEMFVSPPGPAPMTDIELIRLVRGRVDLNIEGVPFKQMDVYEARAEVHSSGRITRVSMNSLRANLPQLNLPIENFTGAVEYHEKVNSDYTPYTGWTILDKFDMVTPKSHLRMQARLDNIPELKGEYSADGSIISLDEFTPLLSDVPKMSGMLSVNQITVSVAGSNDYKILGDLSLVKGKIDEYEIESIHASGELHNKDLTLNRLTGSFSGGTINNAFGTVSFTDVPRYNILANFESIDISKVLPEVPDTILSGEISLVGEGIKPSERSLEVKAELLPSTLLSINLDHLSLRAGVKGEALAIEKVMAERGMGTLLVTGTYSPENVDLRLDMQKIALADVSYLTGAANVAGDFSLQGTLSGSPGNLVLSGHIIGEELRFEDYAMAGLLADVDINITPHLQGRGRLEGENGSIAHNSISKFSADVEVLPNGIEIQSLRAVNPDAEVQSDLFLDFQSGVKVVVHDMALQYKAMRALCPKGFTIQQKGEGWDLSHAGFDLVGLSRKVRNGSHIPGLDVSSSAESSFSMGKFEIEGLFSFSSPSDIRATLAEFPCKGIDTITDQGINWTGNIDSLSFHYFGSIPHPNFELEANISQGPFAEMIGSGHIRFAYKEGLFELENLDYRTSGGYLTGHGDLVLDQSQASPLKCEPLIVNMEDIDLRIFQNLTDAVLIQEGKLTGNVTISGCLDKPVIEGQVHLADARFLLGELNSYISEFSGDIFFKNDRIVFGRSIAQIEADAQDVFPLQGLLDGKPMRLEGEIEVDQLTPKSYDLRFYAGGMNFHGLPGSQFKVAVDVGIAGKSDQLKLFGKAKVLSGLMNMPFGSSDPEQRPELATGVELPFDMDLAIGAERDIWLRNNDADIELAANVRVEYSRGILSLSGELDTIRGKYHFLGRDFDISDGKLTFLGTPSFDPELNIEGVTEIYDETSTTNRMPIYIAVTGTLTHPSIALYSPDHPNLTQNDLVQMLALNLSYNDYMQLQVSGQTSLSNVFNQQQGTQYLYAYLSGQLSPVIRRFTSLDTVSFESATVNMPNPDESFQQQQITVGKYLTRELYLSYTQQWTTLYTTSGMRRVDLEYFLGGGFSILGTANERAREQAAGLSLKYTYRY